MSRFVTSGARPSRLALALCLLHAIGAVAAEPAIDLAAVVVTATRQATRANEVIADVTVIDRTAIEQAGPTTLPALLSRQPGLHVTDNGGPGKSASIFMRGTSAGHTLLLIDGIPFGSATTGTPSLHNLPLSQIERIEILRGPASSLYGSDAIGGVVQVFTRRGEGPPRIDAYAGIGSRNTVEAGSGISGGGGPWSYSVAASAYRSGGFNIAADPVRYRIANGAVPRDDADGYRNNSLVGRLGYRFAPGHELQAHLLEATSNNSVDSGGVNVDAYNRDKSRVFGLQLRNRLGTGWNSTLRLGLGEDNSSNFAPARTQFATQQKQLTWQHDIRVGAGSLMLALENLDQSVTSTTNYGIKDRTVRSLIAGYQGSVGRHSWQAALRHDDNSQFGGHRTGSLAYGYRFAERWQARVAEGTAFKAPSFNQLYFPGFGNAGLQPEKARNREFALHWEEGTRSASLTHFDNRIDNLIAGSPAVNIGKARITGASLAGSLAAGAWTANAGLDLMKPVDASNGNRLQRRPAEMLKLAIAYAGARWRGGVELSAIGRRYDTTTQGRIMGGYSVSNLHAACELDRDWTLEGRINNLFDRVYENAWSYAVPDRQLFVGLRYAPQ
ncbi:MAG: TonB-dependent receptor [Sulfuritalea sp.]|nr:TonB-dependent receptor [Sulfuritalea sp.]